MSHAALQILVCTAKDQDDWQRALSSFLPDAIVHAGLDAPPCDYAVVWKPPAQLFAEQTRLKAIFSLAAGVNGLLAMPSLPRHVPLVRMEDGGMVSQMVEYALYVALRKFRGFDAYRRDQFEHAWSPRPARTRTEFHVGVLGLGVLGGEVARTLASFGFSVCGWSRTPKAIVGMDTAHGSEGLSYVLARSELLLVFLPLTDATEHLLDEKRLRQLPVGAAIANLARGELVDEHALLALLDEGHIGEVFLDVFQQEPLPTQHPLWDHPRVRITPHVAALTDPVIAARQVAQKILQLEAGEAITGLVDVARQY